MRISCPSDSWWKIKHFHLTHTHTFINVSVRLYLISHVYKPIETPCVCVCDSLASFPGSNSEAARGRCKTKGEGGPLLGLASYCYVRWGGSLRSSWANERRQAGRPQLLFLTATVAKGGATRVDYPDPLTRRHLTQVRKCVWDMTCVVPCNLLILHR